MIIIFGYKIFWPLLVLIILSPSIIGFICITISNMNSSKRGDKFYKITKWQKEEINKILEKEIIPGETSEEYENAIRQCQAYVTRQKVWDYELLQETYEYAPNLITTILSEELEARIEKKNIDYAILLCHAIDFVNCGVSTFGRKPLWIKDDIAELKNHKDMDENEARVLSITENILLQTAKLIDPDLDKIPEYLRINDVLKTYSEYDFEIAITEIRQCIDYRNLKRETRDLVSRCLMAHIKDIIKNFEEDILPEHQVYYFRALACSLDGELYDTILDTIEY